MDIPIILYNIPGRTAVNIEVETTARLARDCRNIIGVKESNKDLEHICRVMHRCGRQFLVYSGIELLCFPILALGGAGHVSATGNVMPREVARLYDLAAAGKWEEARDLHYHLLPMNDVLFIETNPVPAKTALGLMGRCTAEVRLPHAPLRPVNEAKLREVMAGYGLLPGVPFGQARDPGAAMRPARFIADGQVHRGRLDGDTLIDEKGRAHGSEVVTWLPPVAPSKIIGFALTYRDHAAELAIQAPPDPAQFL